VQEIFKKTSWIMLPKKRLLTSRGEKGKIFGADIDFLQKSKKETGGEL
jgi:hypothetical protein